MLILAAAAAGCRREAPRSQASGAAVADSASRDTPVRVGGTSIVILSDWKVGPEEYAFTLPDSLDDAALAEFGRPKDFYDSLALELDSTDSEAEDDDAAETDAASARFLTTGTHHGEEVAEGADRHEWLGLFLGDGSCRLAPTRIRIEPFHDEVVDSEGDSSGKEVTTMVEGPTSFLVRDLPGLEAGACEILGDFPREFPPGRRLSFRYRGAEYVLAATIKPPVRNGSEKISRVHGFRLFLTRKTAEGRATACILRLPLLDDSNVSILELGDFDRDGLPDLILDDAGHYNVDATSLYLSRPATPGSLLKKVGSQLTTGC